MNPSLKPKPLPSNAKILDRVEHYLQWFTWLVAWDFPGRPMLGGMATGASIVLFWMVVLYALHLIFPWK